MNYYDDFYDGLNDTRSLLYRQIDTVATLNKLLSTICSEIHNLENYYINVIGENNYIYKIYLKKLIEDMNKFDFKLKELIKIKNGFPIFQIGDIENISLIKTLPSMDYKASTINNNLNNELKIISKLINETLISAQKENDYQTINILSKMQYLINKSIIEIPFKN